MAHTTRMKGFTLVELLVVVGIIAFLISILLPVLSRGIAASRRIKCANNLRQIGIGIHMYAAENKGNYPRTYWVGVGAGPSIYNTGYDQPDPFRPAPAGSVGENNVPAALFLLLRTQKLAPALFVCPSSRLRPDDFEGKDVRERSNFTCVAGLVSTSLNFGPLGRFGNLSYSYANPYPAASLPTFKMHNRMNPEFAVMADLSPGAGAPSVPTDDIFRPSGPSAPEADQRYANSNNHVKEGQNVLFAGGHVRWCRTVWVGIGQNNIYIRDGCVDANGNKVTDTTNINGRKYPYDTNDSVMLPYD